METATRHPLGLLVAPAGSGKTTALVQFAHATPDRHAWYRVEPSDGEPLRLLTCLERTLGSAVPDLLTGWQDIDAAVTALNRVRPGSRTILLIDDLHALAGSPAERLLERLIDNLPPWLSILAASRHTPGFNVSRMRVSETLVDIPEDVLRWRPWEVELLFREHYRERLRPEEAAFLTQRTEGWVAGLQMFHIVSRQLPLARRTQLIEELHTRPGLVRDYLTRNVLGTLPSQLREFLIDTCVLGRLDGPICDRLRGTHDSAGCLRELEARSLFLLAREDGRGYRYHEVLRMHLEVCLLERDGAGAARARYQQAARLMEADGSFAEALRAYARAEAWDDVARLAGEDGPVLARGFGRRVLAGLPAALVTGDPWLRLAQARSLMGEGRLRDALKAYQDAERSFGSTPGSQLCRDEAAAVRHWLEPAVRPENTATDLIRGATRRDPMRMGRLAAGAGDASGLLAGSVCMLLAGDVDEARRLVRAAASTSDIEVFTIAATEALEHVIDLAAGEPGDPDRILRAAKTFERLGLTWLERLARLLGSGRVETVLGEARALGTVLGEHDDPWGRALFALAAGIAAALRGTADHLLDDAAAQFGTLGATTLEAWARAWSALAAAYEGRPQAVSMAEQARSLARSAVTPGAEAMAEQAIAATGDRASEQALARAAAIARALGLRLPATRSSATREDQTPTGTSDALAQPASHVSCFGGLRLVVDGAEVGVSGLRPQTRVVLAMLAMRAGRLVHKDKLTAALWPDEPDVDTARRLQVLVSTLRRRLEPDVTAGQWTRLLRSGKSYVLVLPSGCRVDVQEFDDAVAAASRARHGGDPDAEIAALQRAFDAYSGELLPSFGSAPWVSTERNRYRVQFVRVAHLLAERRLATGDPDGAVEAALAGLDADRYSSQLHRVLIEGYRDLGDPVAMAQAEAEHATILTELGWDPHRRQPTSPVSRRRIREAPRPWSGTRST